MQDLGESLKIASLLRKRTSGWRQLLKLPGELFNRKERFELPGCGKRRIEREVETQSAAVGNGPKERWNRIVWAVQFNRKSEWYPFQKKVSQSNERMKSAWRFGLNQSKERGRLNRNKDQSNRKNGDPVCESGAFNLMWESSNQLNEETNYMKSGSWF